MQIMSRPLFGLALGGGGARGLAHIGVLKVLESEGFRPDCLAGTSMGAIIAALYASGMTPETIRKEAGQMGKLSSVVKLVADDFNFDYALSADTVQEYLREILGKCTEFSHLQIPLAVATVDVRNAREVALQEGDLAKAINASMALPGVAEPVEWDGMRLADGGSLNNVPVDLARSMGTQVVVAVDVSPDVTNERFWKEQRVPEIAAASWRSNAIMVANITAAKMRRARVDLVIRPDIPTHITTLAGFKYVDQLVDCGSEAALKALPELRILLKARISFRSHKLKSASPAQL